MGRRADLIARGSEARAACGVANKVVSEAQEVSTYVRIYRSRITCDNGVEQLGLRRDGLDSPVAGVARCTIRAGAA